MFKSLLFLNNVLKSEPWVLLGGWCTISSFPGLSNFCRSFKILHYHFSPAAAGKKTLSGFYDSLILANSGLVVGSRNQIFNFTFLPSFVDPGIAAHRGRDRLGLVRGQRDQEVRYSRFLNWDDIKLFNVHIWWIKNYLIKGLPAQLGGELYPRLGHGPHLERDQAAVGRGAEGVRQRHVERRGLHHQLPLRGHYRAQNCGVFWCKLNLLVMMNFCVAMNRKFWPKTESEYQI